MLLLHFCNATIVCLRGTPSPPHCRRHMRMVPKEIRRDQRNRHRWRRPIALRLPWQPVQGVPAQGEVRVQRQALQRLQVALQSHHFHHNVSFNCYHIEDNI